MNAYPYLFPMSADEEDDCFENVGERLADLYFETKQTVDDAVSGFWRQPPRKRRVLYDAAGPVFAEGVDLMGLGMWLEQGGDLGPMVPVYKEEMQADPMTGIEVVLPVQIGEAPAILAPYWQQLWAVDREEALKCLKDYSRIMKGEEEKADELAMGEFA